MNPSHAVKNTVLTLALLGAGFLAAWMSFGPDGKPRGLTDGAGSPDAAQPLRFAQWQPAQPVRDAQGNALEVREPALSPDGRWLAFTVGVRGSGSDLWIAPMRGEEPGEARRWAEVDSPADEVAPAFGHGFLYFASNRSGGSGGLDLWRAPFQDGSAGTPEPLPAALQSAQDDTEPAPVPGGSGLVFASNRAGEGPRSWDLYLADAAQGHLGANVLAEFESPAAERDPAFSADGRMLYFVSDRDQEPGQTRIFRSFRNQGGWLAAAPVEGLGLSGPVRSPRPTPMASACG
ncbi:MAG: hypothetical protein R3E96_02120 [Planctomycetota bacterium]